MKFLICLALTFIAVALIDGTSVPIGHHDHCPDRCVSTSAARKECRFKSSCKLIDCSLSKRSLGKRCSPKFVTPQTPPPLPHPASCPQVCKASYQVKRECRRFGRKCKIASCNYTHHGRVTHGSSCVDTHPPPPPSHSCPQKCLRRRIGTRQCNQSIYRAHCELVSCTLTVRGRSRGGVKCVSKEVTPTPEPDVCPEQCSSRRSARRQCREPRFRSLCRVKECSLGSHGNVGNGYICTRDDVTTSPPTTTTTTESTTSTTTATTTTTMPPTTTTSTTESRTTTTTATTTTTMPPTTTTSTSTTESTTTTTTATTTTTMPPTTTTSTTESTTTTTTATTTTTMPPTTTTMASCPDCPLGQFLTSDGTCGCVDTPCAACPDGSVCQTAEDASGLDIMVCVTCDCGYCDVSNVPCCRINARGNNCVSGSGVNQECQVDNFVISAVGNSNANVCRGEEKPSLELVNTCGCVPSNAQACSLPAVTSGNCFVERV